MDVRPNLEALYQQAQEALADGKVSEASALLKQILLLDDDYKDAAHLLAKFVASQHLQEPQEGG
jgi:thioredoxin-like negative regulator of GroEL